MVVRPWAMRTNIHVPAQEAVKVTAISNEITGECKPPVMVLSMSRKKTSPMI
jgi:hypothetical protein